MIEYELAAKRILTAKGFTSIRKRSSGCDFDAEKDSVQYLIEVKGGSQSTGFPLSGPKWSQIGELSEAASAGKKGLLIFINAKYYEYAIFEITDSGPIENTEAIRIL